MVGVIEDLVPVYAFGTFADQVESPGGSEKSENQNFRTVDPMQSDRKLP
jgi:hypothetical protein